MKLRIYLDTDGFGNINFPYLIGTRVIPDKDYGYYFEAEESEVNIDTFSADYEVNNGNLVRKEA